MKVVLFCGGRGLRIREYDENVPKPMIPIGYRPILWHVMKYYAHFGHRDFILCLGYGADVIKNYFLKYDEAISNDFVLSEGGRRRELLSTDMSEWRISFVDTGRDANLGQRLLAVRPHLDGEEVFLANYADGLTDLALDRHVATFLESDKVASFLSVRPNLSYDFVAMDGEHRVVGLQSAVQAGLRINGGYFVLRRDFFDYIQSGEELVREPFRRLLEKNRLMAYAYDGFFLPMDTFKEKEQLDELYARGEAPWEVWASSRRKRSADPR